MPKTTHYYQRKNNQHEKNLIGNLLKNSATDFRFKVLQANTLQQCKTTVIENHFIRFDLKDSVFKNDISDLEVKASFSTKVPFLYWSKLLVIAN